MNPELARLRRAMEWARRTEPDGFRDPFFRRVFDMLNTEELFGATERARLPAMDLIDEKDRLLVLVELPGIDPKQVQIQLQNDLLTLRGERREQDESGKNKHLEREHIFGAFEGSLQLPYRVQSENIRAHYENGILTVELPKADEQVGRQIQIEIEK